MIVINQIFSLIDDTGDYGFYKPLSNEFGVRWQTGKTIRTNVR